MAKAAGLGLDTTDPVVAVMEGGKPTVIINRRKDKMEPVREHLPDVEGNEQEKLKAMLSREHELYLRTLADFDNYRKRREREQAGADRASDGQPAPPFSSCLLSAFIQQLKAHPLYLAAYDASVPYRSPVRSQLLMRYLGEVEKAFNRGSSRILTDLT